MKQLKLLLFGALLLLAGNSVNAQCQASFTPSTWTPNTYDTVVFTNNSSIPTGAGVIHYWTIDQRAYTTTIDFQHVFTQPGGHYVCFEIIDSATNCSSSYCDSIVVSGKIASCNFSIEQTQIDSCYCFAPLNSRTGLQK